mmetsp:Transcript_78022/g.220587  ORF Transcript_78022/g.220587 Transcript_78022/m.220587 type:complete len:324 (-) Transcript_78022:30-1001(-)|eukprot:CAMPEP_0168364506 /NCGR_PEP_ID=MMETSP0228-20121227/4242_1 /TAXON_ID=133427 /ORGANISM="Protoceratium reticulatum, Strain CCCM 535 (=CCMP 1889)" /LENGTH=323 /DNA_ID=CAMNT_0008377267 /DNA_START=78 /DNA_END=1049 /DNA_ORIENTATION=-
MAESDAGAENLLESKQYDLTSCNDRVNWCCMISITLHLEPEEAVLETKTCISNETRRMPYGELGSVEKTTSCGCCYSFDSNLSPTSEGTKVPISPGCGCDAALVDEVVAELKGRMKARGDTGNIQRAEESLKLMRQLASGAGWQDAKFDALLQNLRLPVPQTTTQPDEKVQGSTFEHMDYNMTDYGHAICTCGGHKLLHLGPEEVEVEVTTCCSASKKRSPYGELGNVQQSVCCGCHWVSSDLEAFSPGCGCEAELVEEVVTELKQRMKQRGDTGNIQRQEETIRLLNQLMAKIMHQDAKLNAVLGQMGAPVPAAPPALQTMG